MHSPSSPTIWENMFGTCSKHFKQIRVHEFFLLYTTHVCWFLTCSFLCASRLFINLLFMLFHLINNVYIVYTWFQYYIIDPYIYHKHIIYVLYLHFLTIFYLNIISTYHFFLLSFKSWGGVCETTPTPQSITTKVKGVRRKNMRTTVAVERVVPFMVVEWFTVLPFRSIIRIREYHKNPSEMDGRFFVGKIHFFNYLLIVWVHPPPWFTVDKPYIFMKGPLLTFTFHYYRGVYPTDSS